MCAASAATHAGVRAQARDHTAFVCRLRDRWPQRDTLALRIARQLTQCGYIVQDTPLQAAERVLALPHIRSSTLVDVDSGEDSAV